MRNKGFTLVELMVVVAIIIILAAILVPRYMDVTDTAKAAKCQANQRTLEGAATVYMADHDGTLPASLGAMVGDQIDAVPECPGGEGTAPGGSYEGTYNATTGAITCPNGIASHART